MSNINRIRKYYATMDGGEKAYMANKLWKDDRVVAAKVKQYIPEDVLYPAPPAVTYARGDKFIHCGQVYILVSCDAKTMALVSLDDGNRWNDAQVTLSPTAVTEAEFNLITCGVTFKGVK
jgi:hypothetical protein